MELMIQDPTYAASMRLGEALIDACGHGSNGAGAFAFAEENGVDLFLGDTDFDKYIKKNTFDLIVGTDSITDPKAIAKLRAYDKRYRNLKIYGYIHDARKYLFHPKITWFKTAVGGLSIIGSGNLTERGLYHNLEMYSYDTLTSTEFNKLKTDWDDWVNFSISNNFLFDINDPIVDHAVNLSAKKKISVSSITKGATIPKTGPNKILIALYGKQPKSISISASKTFHTSKISKTKPKSAATILAKPVPSVTPVVVPSTISTTWKVSPTDRVLVAEVPKASTRWKQINFDKASFIDYFGATPGNLSGTYRILLKNVNSYGSLGTTELRPSVSVASHNFRFEINAANGIPYPAGGNRPYVVFSETSTRSFIYELVMPGDSRYTEVDTYAKSWKKTYGIIDTRMARIITDVKTLKCAAPNLGLWKI